MLPDRTSRQFSEHEIDLIQPVVSGPEYEAYLIHLSHLREKRSATATNGKGGGGNVKQNGFKGMSTTAAFETPPPLRTRARAATPASNAPCAVRPTSSANTAATSSASTAATSRRRRGCDQSQQPGRPTRGIKFGVVNKYWSDHPQAFLCRTMSRTMSPHFHLSQ
eukprot:Selendium_serpulae@DN6283_c3_g2_i5.p1